MTLGINSAEVLLRGIGALAGEKLAVMPGDVVRVHLGVDYRGPAIDGLIHVSFGRKETIWPYFFNEDGNKQSDTPVHFDQSIDFLPYVIICDVPIGGSSGENYDLYAKIMGVPGPDIESETLLNVLDVLGVAEFSNFEITSYEKV